jgi:hypothetical protein
MSEQDVKPGEPEVLPTKDELIAQGGVDLDNLPKQQHNWVKRGIVMSCEGMMHPSHRHFLVRK